MVKVGDLMKLLIVEDEKTLNKVISKRLESSGYSVFSCFDGEEALQALMKESFDVIVMDIMMPKLSGIEVLKEMKLKGIETPVLFLTAKDTVEDRVYGLDLGAEDYLVKPFSFEELMARIRVILRSKSSNNSTILSRFQREKAKGLKYENKFIKILYQFFSDKSITR